MNINRGQLDALIKELDSLGYDIDDDEIDLSAASAQGGGQYLIAKPEPDKAYAKEIYVHPNGVITT